MSNGKLLPYPSPSTKFNDATGIPSTVTATNPLPVLAMPGSAGSLQLKHATYGALSVTTTAVEVKTGASPLANRIVITVLPTNGTVWLGYDNLVTSATGIPVDSGELCTIDATTTLGVWVISAGTVDVRITEGSDV